MVGFYSGAILVANSIALIYYSSKWASVRRLHKKIEGAVAVQLTEKDLKDHAGGYVFLTGTIRAVSDPFPSKFSSTVNAVVQNIQRIKHQIVRIAGFWVRKREVLESVQCRHGKMALFNAAGDVKVDVRDPIWGLNQASTLDLFTGYRNVTWPVSNVFFDTFTVNAEAVNPFKMLLNGVQEVGIQETESLILDGGNLSALGYLRFKDEQFNIMVDLLTACDRSMLLKKISDIRAELATKIVIFGTMTLVMTLIFFSRRKRGTYNDFDD